MEQRQLISVGGCGLNLIPLPNGVLTTGLGAFKPTDLPEVLYLARLHKRKRPDLFVRAALSLLDQGIKCRFAIVGPDGGMATVVNQLVGSSAHSSSISIEGALNPDKVMDRIARSDIYVLPAVDEPFPMSVLEAMAVGKPVVVTDSCGLAPAIERHSAGAVGPASEEFLVHAIKLLVSENRLRAAMGKAAFELVERDYNMTNLIDELVEIYELSASRNAASDLGWASPDV